jgi:proteic killer suppression protein
MNASDRQLPQSRHGRHLLRYGQPGRAEHLSASAWPVAVRKLAMLVQAKRLADLKKPYGNRLHALKRDRAGEHAIRINDTYRICFRWTDAGAEDVEITDYHH